MFQLTSSSNFLCWSCVGSCFVFLYSPRAFLFSSVDCLRAIGHIVTSKKSIRNASAVFRCCLRDVNDAPSVLDRRHAPTLCPRAFSLRSIARAEPDRRLAFVLLEEQRLDEVAQLLQEVRTHHHALPVLQLGLVLLPQPRAQPFRVPFELLGGAGHEERGGHEGERRDPEDDGREDDEERAQRGQRARQPTVARDAHARGGGETVRERERCDLWQSRQRGRGSRARSLGWGNERADWSRRRHGK